LTEATLSKKEKEGSSKLKKLWTIGANAIKFTVSKSTRMKQYMTFLAQPGILFK